MLSRIFKFEDKDDYLNLKLTKEEKQLLSEFGEKFVNNCLQDKLFDKKKVIMEDIRFLDISFIKLIESHNLINGKNYYRTPNNFEEIAEFNNVRNILLRKVYAKNSSERNIKMSKLFVEILLYLKIIEL